jgi:DNA-binding transcriptional MocR family regulator
MQRVAFYLFQHLTVIATEHQRESQLRYAAAAAAFATHLPASRWQTPRGGSSLWIDTGMDANRLVLMAARAGISIGAGGAFFPSGRSGTHIRVAITRSPETLELSIARLASAFRMSD